jgi:ubiquinone/menaquinone biosynthesis C-methylase UbiE
MDDETVSFYDHFTQGEKMPTKIGMSLVRIKNKRIFNILYNLRNQKKINILEIGPGRGVFAETCVKDDIEYTAIEINSTLANNLSKRGFNVINSKAPPIPIKANKFDIVYMNQVFEHMDNIEMAQNMIEESYRLLKKGGILCIISPDYLMWKEEFFNGDYTHNYVTTTKRLKDIYYDNGFRVVHMSYTAGPFFGDVVTYFLGIFNRLLIKPYLIHLISFGLLSENRVYKIRTTLFRSFIIVGVK